MHIHEEWFSIATNDLKAAKILLPENLHIIASYHIQQCIEKALKGYLVFHNEPVRKIHDLTKLVQTCILLDKTFSQLLESAIDIDPYVTGGRYPNQGIDLPEKPEIEAAIYEAEQIVKFIQNKVKT